MQIGVNHNVVHKKIIQKLDECTKFNKRDVNDLKNLIDKYIPYHYPNNKKFIDELKELGLDKLNKLYAELCQIKYK